MIWILMIYFGNGFSDNPGQGGFSTEFSDLQACKAAYQQYVESRPYGVRGRMSGVCVQKKSGTK